MTLPTACTVLVRVLPVALSAEICVSARLAVKCWGTENTPVLRLVSIERVVIVSNPPMLLNSPGSEPAAFDDALGAGLAADAAGLGGGALAGGAPAPSSPAMA